MSLNKRRVFCKALCHCCGRQKWGLGPVGGPSPWWACWAWGAAPPGPQQAPRGGGAGLGHSLECAVLLCSCSPCDRGQCRTSLCPSTSIQSNRMEFGGELNATVHSKHSVQGLHIVSGCKDELLFFCASWMTETPWCVWGTFSRLTCSAAGGWSPELAKVENCENWGILFIRISDLR